MKSIAVFCRFLTDEHRRTLEAAASRWDYAVDYYTHFDQVPAEKLPLYEIIYGNLSLFSLYDLPDVLGEDVAAAVIDAAKIAEKQFFTSVIETEIEMKKLMWNAVSAAIKQSQPIEAQADIAGRHRVFAPVFEYIADHAGEMISLEKLIPLTDFSKDSFYRAFKKTVGMPPRDYMLYQRLLYARRLLFTTDLSVKEISEKAGYTSPSAFGAVFVEKYGTSPKRYRTSVKKQ